MVDGYSSVVNKVDEQLASRHFLYDHLSVGCLMDGYPSAGYLADDMKN